MLPQMSAKLKAVEEERSSLKRAVSMEVESRMELEGLFNHVGRLSVYVEEYFKYVMFNTGTIYNY